MTYGYVVSIRVCKIGLCVYLCSYVECHILNIAQVLKEIVSLSHNEWQSLRLCCDNTKRKFISVQFPMKLFIADAGVVGAH